MQTRASKLPSIEGKVASRYLMMVVISVALTTLPLWLITTFSAQTSLNAMFLAEFILGLVAFYLFFWRQEKYHQGHFRFTLTLFFIILLLQLLAGMNQSNTFPGQTLSAQEWLLIIVMILLAPFYEEVIYRGCLLGFLSFLFKGQLYWPVVLSSALFTLMHTQYSNAMDFIFLFIIGCLFAWIRIKTQGLYHAIFLHAAMNGCVALATLFSRIG